MWTVIILLLLTVGPFALIMAFEREAYAFIEIERKDVMLYGLQLTKDGRIERFIETVG